MSVARFLMYRLIRAGHLPEVCVAWALLLIGAASSFAVSTVWTGPTNGDFLSDANWSLDAPESGDSAIFNNNFNGNVAFSGSIDTLDLFLRNSTGTITFDVDPSGLGHLYRMSRFTIVGAAAGETNQMIVASGDLETGIVLIGNADGANNNRVEVTGDGTYWKATGGTGGTAAIRVGSNGGSTSSLIISDGGRMESTTQTIIGLQGASNNELVVTGAGSQYANAQSISLGDNIAPEKPNQTNNQLKVLDGGFVTTRELIIGTTAKSPDNTVTVSGSGSRLNVRGGQQFPPTEGGQRHDIGRASSNNRLLVEDGGVVDGNAIFLLGREAASLNNLLSISNGSLSGWGVEIRQGKVVIDQGSIEISRAFDNLALQYLGGSLLAETSQAEIDFRSGSLATVNANVDNSSVFTIGDGGTPSATYRMKLNPQTGSNGTHRFADGLALASNGILSGGGDIGGDVSGSAGAQVEVGASAGVMNVAGDWNNTGMDISIELDNLASSLIPGEQFDQLNITSEFTHGGTVTIDLSELVAPATAEPLKLIGWGSEAGLSTSTMVSFLGGSPLTYDFLSDGLYVTVEASAGTLGDYNNNGVVDAADYVVWRDNEGANNTLPNNTLPGPIGLSHYNQWKANFGKSSASGAGLTDAAGATVPEPAAWALWMAAIACGVFRRRSEMHANFNRAADICRKGA
ncbi:MAG: hypothetical protein WD851_12365 [Pirellulales bacterium]